jgi:hypothetical protein
MFFKWVMPSLNRRERSTELSYLLLVWVSCRRLGQVYPGFVLTPAGRRSPNNPTPADREKQHVLQVGAILWSIAAVNTPKWTASMSGSPYMHCHSCKHRSISPSSPGFSIRCFNVCLKLCCRQWLLSFGLTHRFRTNITGTNRNTLQ